MDMKSDVVFPKPRSCLFRAATKCNSLPQNNYFGQRRPNISDWKFYDSHSMKNYLITVSKTQNLHSEIIVFSFGIFFQKFTSCAGFMQPQPALQLSE